jgi:hypothetical protein
VVSARIPEILHRELGQSQTRASLKYGRVRILIDADWQSALSKLGGYLDTSSLDRPPPSHAFARDSLEFDLHVQN